MQLAAVNLIDGGYDSRRAADLKKALAFEYGRRKPATDRQENGIDTAPAPAENEAGRSAGHGLRPDGRAPAA